MQPRGLHVQLVQARDGLDRQALGAVAEVNLGRARVRAAAHEAALPRPAPARARLALAGLPVLRVLGPHAPHRRHPAVAHARPDPAVVAPAVL
eukprot:2295878-Rhodomonas_salina.1